MRKKSVLRALVPALLATLAIPLAFFVLRPGVSAAATPVRVMPLGDSITGSPGCWRSVLWNQLVTTGYTNIDFVGTLGPQGCGQAHDGDNEGHGGYLATNVADQNLLPGWLSRTSPDIVLMHFGTNDVWSNRSPATILTAFGKLVDQMRANKPTMRILVAKIIPMNPSTCSECAQRAVDLNNAIPNWANGKTTAQSPITVVDQWAGFSTSSDTYDGVHPNAAGDRKMAAKWYPALTNALNRLTPTQSVTPSRTASSTPSVTPSAGSSASPTSTPSMTMPPLGCTATYQQTGQWQGAFQGEFTVRNIGGTSIGGWAVTFSFANGQQITQSWSAELSQSGSTVTARNASWNGPLAVNATTTFGFIANWTGANTAPTASCTPR